MQQYGCRKCGSYWVKSVKYSIPLDIFAGLRIPVVLALKAVAMFAIELPMCRIEQLLGLKAETVKKLIVHFTGKEEIWDFVKEFVMSNFRILEDEIDRLGAIQDEFLFRQEPFRGRALDFRLLDPLERRKVMRRAIRIAKRNIAI
jgi:hypothetical protein